MDRDRLRPVRPARRCAPPGQQVGMVAGNPSDTRGVERVSEAFRRFAAWCAQAFGHPAAFALACLLVAVWAAAGPAAGYSDTWQLVVNTGTTVATWLMIFVLQHTQNRDTRATHLKLDEIIR